MPRDTRGWMIWLVSVVAVVALLAWLFMFVPAAAAVMGYAQIPEGRIELHDEAGPVCVGIARRADFIAADGAVIGGCWTVRGLLVAIVFLDGDVVAVPLDRIKKPADG